MRTNTLVESSSILVQPYSEYNMLQKIRLSAAYMVNPTLANQTKIGYFISSKELNDEQTEEIMDSLKENQLSNAFYDGNKFYKILGSQDQGWEKNLHEWKLGFITDDKALADKLNGEPVVTWGEVRRVEKEKVLELSDPE